MARGVFIATCLLLVFSLCLVECTQKVVEMRMSRFNYRKWLAERVYQEDFSDAAAPVKVPLLGNETALGEYYIRFTIGGQTFTAQVDTGSSDLAIPGIGCTSCSLHKDPPYNPKSSPTSAVVSCTNPPSPLKCNTKLCDGSQCAYIISYGDGSGFDADVYTDKLVIPGFTAVTQAFGSMTKEIKPKGGGNFEPFQTDGIMGFAYSVLSEINAPTPFDNLVASGQAANVFSMCLTNDGGTLTLGGIGPYNSGPIQYTPITQELFYSVTVTDVSFNGASVKVSSSILNGGVGSIVDSGTTDLILPSSVLNDIKATALSMCPTVNLVGTCGVNTKLTIFDGICYVMTPQQVAMYPPINITLAGNVVVSVPPQYWLTLGACRQTTAYSIAIGTQLRGIILGDTAMKNYEVVFDRANKRVGFGKIGTCPDGNQSQ